MTEETTRTFRTLSNHSDFAAEWDYHRSCCDFWSFQGLLHEMEHPEYIYAFRVALQRILSGRERFWDLYYSFDDIIENRMIRKHIFVPYYELSRTDLYLDRESFFYQELIQMLIEGRAIALRLNGDDAADRGFALELRLDQSMEEQWPGRDGLWDMAPGQRLDSQVTVGILPFMNAIGHLDWEDDSVRLVGACSAERMWGKLSYQHSALHWEKIYISFLNGNEIFLVNLPVQNSGLAYFAHSGHPGFSLPYVLTPTEYVKIGNWMFSKSWTLELDKPAQATWTLAPLNDEQFILPISRPLLGVYDANGDIQGYAHAELMPGARSKARIVPNSLYRRY